MANCAPPGGPAPTLAELTELADRVDRLLPQTQCTQCGYAGCRPYADAIAAGQADFNRCPPGGATGISQLAALLGKPPKPLNPAHGAEKPRTLARVVEARCIGCTLCIQACPVDAIIGAPGFMHSVIAELCTGCDLCIPPCPVDCIERVPAEPLQGPWDTARADAARERHLRRKSRLAREDEEARARLAHRATALAGEKAAAAQAALARARARKQQPSTP